MASEALLTAKEAGNVLGVSQRTIQRLAQRTRDGLPPKYKLPGPNGQYLFDPADVAEYKAAVAARKAAQAARQAADEEDKKVASSP